MNVEKKGGGGGLDQSNPLAVGLRSSLRVRQERECEFEEGGE